MSVICSAAFRTNSQKDIETTPLSGRASENGRSVAKAANRKTRVAYETPVLYLILMYAHKVYTYTLQSSSHYWLKFLETFTLNSPEKLLLTYYTASAFHIINDVIYQLIHVPLSIHSPYQFALENTTAFVCLYQCGQPWDGIFSPTDHLRGTGDIIAGRNGTDPPVRALNTPIRWRWGLLRDRCSMDCCRDKIVFTAATNKVIFACVDLSPREATSLKMLL